MAKRVVPVLVAIGALGLWSCGDIQSGDPAGQGAGRPDTTPGGTAAETPSLEVLQGAGVGARERPGALPLDTAVIDTTARVDG